MQQARQTQIGGLLSRVASGDRAAFDMLYEATSAQLHALGVSILKDRPIAEDALEQVYLRIWSEAGRQPESGLSPMAWLLTLTRDMALERMRAEGLPGGLTRPDPVEALWLEGASLQALARREGRTAPAMREMLRARLAALRGGRAPQEAAQGAAR